MPRSLLTLAAAVTAVVPGAEVVGVRPLTSGGGGRFDSAVATLADGREFAVRAPVDESAEHELSAEVVVLRALTSGVRELLGFAAPEHIGSVRMGDTNAAVTTFLRGYLVDPQEIPAGRGAATSIGRSVAAIHALPGSVVRSAGLPVRSAEESRAHIERVLDTAAASGHVPVRLMVRWREALEDDRLWAYESAVCLGGTQSTSFVLADDVAGAPHVAGVLDWQGLSIDDPALDLRWVASAPDAADDVFDAYSTMAHRAPDAALRIRARLHAELEFAHWLVHCIESHRDEDLNDAIALLDSLSDGLRDDRLLAGFGHDASDVDGALAAIGKVPEARPTVVDTSMQTDAYDPSQLSLDAETSWDDPRHESEDAVTRATDTSVDTVPSIDTVPSMDAVPSTDAGAPEDAGPSGIAPEVRLPSAQPADDQAGATVPFDMEAYIAAERATRSRDDTTT